MSKIDIFVPQLGQGSGRGQGGGPQGNRSNQTNTDRKIAEILDDNGETRLAELVIQRAGN